MRSSGNPNAGGNPTFGRRRPERGAPGKLESRRSLETHICQEKADLGHRALNSSGSPALSKKPKPGKDRAPSSCGQGKVRPPANASDSEMNPLYTMDAHLTYSIRLLWTNTGELKSQRLAITRMYRRKLLMR